MTEEKTSKNYKADSKELSGSEIEITGSIEWSEVEKYREKALKKLGEHVKVDGFRKGKVPEAIVLKQVGEMTLLNEMAEEALREIYPKIVFEQAPKAIGRPHITITKLAKDNPLEFKATTAVIPKVKLSDYKKVAKKVVKKHAKDDLSVTDKEVSEALKELRKQWAISEKFQEAQKNGEQLDPNTIEIKDADLPELTTEMVKTLGDFEDVPDFEAKLKENIGKDKERKQSDKIRMEILDELVKEATIDLPGIIIEGELDTMQAQFEADVERAQVKIDDYLKHIGKSKEALRNDWKADAEKRAKIQFILAEIARSEDIHVDKEKVNEELNKIKEQFKDREINELNARIHIESTLVNQMVLEFLESQK